MPPRAEAERGAWFQPSVNSIPLSRWTMRSPPTPVPYSLQQRHRTKRSGLSRILGAWLSHVSQSRLDVDRFGGNGYCQAPFGLFLPYVTSTISNLADSSGFIELVRFGRKAKNSPFASRSAQCDGASGRRQTRPKRLQGNFYGE